MNKIKTFEAACKALGIPTTVPDFSAMPAKHQKALLAHFKLIIIAEALNAGWQPNWNDYNETKYYPWFEVEASEENTAGFGFSGTDYGFGNSYSHVGSRLCFKSRELAKYAGETFTELYKDYFLIAK